MSDNKFDELSVALAKLSKNQQLPAKANPKRALGKVTQATQKPQVDKLIGNVQCPLSDQVFSDINWRNIDCEEMLLANSEFHHCDFSDASLAFLTAKNCKFYDCNFARSSLKESHFDQCTFYASERQTGCNFYAAELLNAKFSRCDISLCVFERAAMFGVEIIDSKAQGSSFKQASFSSVISRTKLFCSAFFNKSNFRYADFEGCQLEKCDLSDSSFVNASFYRANLTGCLLHRSDLSAIQCDKLPLAGADLRNAELGGLDLRNVDLSGAKINDWQQKVLLESISVIVYPD